MAGRNGDGDDFATTERVLAAGGVSKRRRNLSNKTGGDRLRSTQAKSPKRRPATPEPEKRVFSDESERETSDSDTIRRATHGGRGRDRSDIMRRTRSKERPPQKDTTTEIEDDFELIRQMHKAKQFEESTEETKREKIDATPVVKELKEREIKEMPALIESIAPQEKPKRARPKTLPLREEIPTAKPRTRSRSRPRKLSTSEEDDEANLALKGKLVLKPKEGTVIKGDVRRRRLTSKKATSQDNVSDKTEEINCQNGQDVEESTEDKVEENVLEIVNKPWFFKRWFSQNEKENAVETEKSESKEDLNLEGEVEITSEPVAPIIISNEEEVECEDDEEEVEAEQVEEDSPPVPETTEPAKSNRIFMLKLFSEWADFKEDYREDYQKIKKLRNRCASGLLIIILFCGAGGFIFRFTEGTFESFYKCGVKRVKRDFIDTLWGYSQYMPMEDWKSQARMKLMKFETELHAAHEAGMTSYSGQKSWSFLNAVVYSLTVITTIGYGHISPVTATGRAITVVYAIIGIPIFLILLADFGKLFTRAIKFLWVFVRRVYYTGSCKKVRKTVQVQDMMKGVQAVYDFARRTSQMPGTGQPGEQPLPPPTLDSLKPPNETSPGDVPEIIDTPAPSQFDIDDEFNLPISVAITILITYILIGATIYSIWEDWSFFECFYFVFISMSTIGFGDFVPNHPMYMMLSMVYLVFGLALTSMCINVVQEKLSDTFKQASAKLGTTMGLDVIDDENPNLALYPEQLANGTEPQNV